MRRFHTPPESIHDAIATIDGQEAKHISQVLRLEQNEQIEIFDGTGSVYLAQIKSIEKRTVKALIIKSIAVKNNAPFLFVAQSLLKGKKMDFLYQKLTELSVEGVFPVISQYSEAKPRQDKQNKRWQKISLEACKQCKRPSVMHCYDPTSFHDILEKSANFDTKILFWENETAQFLSSFPEIQKTPRSTLILLGPEGGFSNSEVQQATQKGFSTVSLGPRILRAETAAVSASSIVQYILGNLSQTDTIDWGSICEQ